MGHKKSGVDASNASDAALRFRLVDEHWFPSEAEDFVIRLPNPRVSSQTGGLADTSKWLDTIAGQLVDCPTREAASTIEDIVQVDFGAGTIPARALITTSCKAQFISASIRFSDGKRSKKHTKVPEILQGQAIQILPKTDRLKARFLFSPDAVSDVVLRSLGLVRKNSGDEIRFGSDDCDVDVERHPSGVIVISGGTGTGKSLYARGIVLRWLIRLAVQRFSSVSDASKCEFSPPHLVTYEDPIEGWKINFLGEEPKSHDLCGAPEHDLVAGIRVTARAKGFDVDNLNNACLHALRQKPQVIYLGECRVAKDWKRAISLGATGHLVVTTCHASSLIDTFVKLVGTGDQDAESRQELVGSIRGVLHLQNGPLSTEDLGIDCELKHTQTFFSLWRQTEESRSNFVVDGLASLVIDGENIVGRSEMTSRILELQGEGSFDIEMRENQKLHERLKEIASRDAFKMDVRGQ